MLIDDSICCTHLMYHVHKIAYHELKQRIVSNLPHVKLPDFLSSYHVNQSYALVELRGSATFRYFFFIIEPRSLKIGMRM